METVEKTLSTKVKVLKEEPCAITFSIELPLEDVDRETNSVFETIRSRASLSGFRTGKAPMDLVRKNFSDRARQTVLENLIGRSAAQVIRERKLQTIDTPKVEKIEFEPGKPFVFHMTIEKDPEVKAKTYKGIKVNQKTVNVTADMITKTLEDLRERNATLVASTDTKVAKNHFLVIDFDGKIDGKPFQGGSASNYLLDMTQPQTIAGFSEGLLGAALGEKRDVTVTFPADYPQKEWAGKQAIFDVLVKEIKQKNLPALDDEFAKDMGLASLDEIKQKVQESLEKEETAKADKQVEDQLYQALLDEHSFPVPPTLVEERTKALVKRSVEGLVRQGLIKKGDAQAEETLRERSKPQAEKDVRLSYLLKAIAEQEKLHAGDADVAELKNKALAENKDNPEAVNKYFTERDASIRASLTEDKVLAFLKSNAKIKMVKD